MRSVLLTGATGFIGGHLAKRLVKLGCLVTSLQRSSTVVSGINETLAVSELNPETISNALSGRKFDWAFHLASYGVNPVDRGADLMFRVNVDVNRRLVQEAAGWPAKALVVVGSGAEYDLSCNVRAVPESYALEMFRLYGASKAIGSLSALALARSEGLPLAVARLFGTFGANEAEHRLFPTLVKKLSQGIYVPLSDGKQQRDLLYVEDTVSALVSLAEILEAKPQQIVVNVCSGIATSVRSFAELVAEILGVPESLLGFGEVPRRQDDVSFFVGDPSRFMQLSGWTPKFPLAAGVRLGIDEILGVEMRR